MAGHGVCRALEIAPSPYWSARSRPPSARALSDAVLAPLLVALFVANYSVYGRRKLTKAAHRAGIDIGRAAALPLSIADQRRTPGAVVEEVDRLLDHHTDAGVVAALNAAGILSGTGQPFNVAMIRHIRSDYSLRSHEDRRREHGLVGLGEIAQRLGVCTSTVKRWHGEGLIEAEVYNDNGERLYRVPVEAPFKKIGRPAGPSKESSAATNPGGAV